MLSCALEPEGVAAFEELLLLSDCARKRRRALNRGGEGSALSIVASLLFRSRRNDVLERSRRRRTLSIVPVLGVGVGGAVSVSGTAGGRGSAEVGSPSSNMNGVLLRRRWDSTASGGGEEAASCEGAALLKPYVKRRLPTSRVSNVSSMPGVCGVASCSSGLSGEPDQVEGSSGGGGVPTLEPGMSCGPLDMVATAAMVVMYGGRREREGRWNIQMALDKAKVASIAHF